MSDLTPIQLIVLRFAIEYGPMVDFGGRGANRAHLNAAKQLIAQGLMSGSYRGASITDAGRAAIAT